MLLSVPSDWARCRSSRATDSSCRLAHVKRCWVSASAPAHVSVPCEAFFRSDRAFREPHQKGLKSPQKKNGNWRWSELTKRARASEQDTYLFISTFFQTFSPIWGELALIYRRFFPSHMLKKFEILSLYELFFFLDSRFIKLLNSCQTAQLYLIKIPISSINVWHSFKNIIMT